MQTSEVLNRAADLIEERGWTTGGGWNEYDGSPLCLEGGILAALGLPNDQMVSMWKCDAYTAVADHLEATPRDVSKVSARYGCREVWRFNDAPQRTASEVIEVLRACAVIEASRERESAEVREQVSA